MLVLSKGIGLEMQAASMMSIKRNILRKSLAMAT